jgi:hypothetical protein
MPLHGTWKVTGGAGGSSGPALVVIGVLLLLGSGGAVAAVAAALVDALIAVAVVVVLVVAALAAFLVHLARHPGAIPRIVPAPAVHQLPAPERPAIAPKVSIVEHHHYMHVAPGADAEGVKWLPLRDAVIEKEN